MYANASKANRAVLPGQRLLCSEDAGWTSALLEAWRHPGSFEYSTVPTPDQLIVVTVSGRYKLESYSQGVWKAAQKSPGMCGASAPFNASRLRSQSNDTPFITLQTYLPQCFFEEAAEEFRRAGSSFVTTPLDYLGIKDSFVSETIRALARGIEAGAPDLYCAAACQVLATHLLLLNGRLTRGDLERSIGHDLKDRRLARVLEYMQQHATQAISLDQLAREAGVSRFHFVRLFKQKVGITPHEYLVDLRLQKVANLLETTDLDISAIARQSGYSNAGRFAYAFRRRFSVNPSAYRLGGPLV